MAPKPIILLISIASVAIGTCLLITSSISLDYYRKLWENRFCNLPTILNMDKCQDNLRFWLSATSFGVIAGAIQILSFVAAYFKKMYIWCGLHFFICVLCAVVFAIAMDQRAFNHSVDRYPDKVIAFTVFALIDMVFAFVVSIGMVFAIRNSKFELN